MVMGDDSSPGPRKQLTVGNVVGAIKIRCQPKKDRFSM